MASFTDRELMEQAIELARKCQTEEGRESPSPKVGAIVSRNGGVIDSAYRGELHPGDHAEFTLLESKLLDESLVGSTLFTTLEPCTKRNLPKVPCAQRIIERKIKKVFIGTPDPNPDIRGGGLRALINAGINIALFDQDLIFRIEEMNRDFSRQFLSDHPTTHSEARESTERNVLIGIPGLISRAHISSGNRIIGSENLVSITDGGVGEIDLLWGADYATNDYQLSVTPRRGTFEITAKTRSGVSLEFKDFDGLAIDVEFDVWAIGEPERIT